MRVGLVKLPGSRAYGNAAKSVFGPLKWGAQVGPRGSAVFGTPLQARNGRGRQETLLIFCEKSKILQNRAGNSRVGGDIAGEAAKMSAEGDGRIAQGCKPTVARSAQPQDLMVG